GEVLDRLLLGFGEGLVVGGRRRRRFRLGDGRLLLRDFSVRLLLRGLRRVGLLVGGVGLLLQLLGLRVRGLRLLGSRGVLGRLLRAVRLVLEIGRRVPRVVRLGLRFRGLRLGVLELALGGIELALRGVGRILGLRDVVRRFRRRGNGHGFLLVDQRLPVDRHAAAVARY